MKFGICTTLSNASAAKATGWDYVEESVQGFLQGLIPDAQWKGLDLLARSPLPVPAANLLVPGSLKITGSDANLDKLRAYMTSVIARSAKTDTRTLVFGSAGARNVPDGFDRETARRQILDFAKTSADIAAAHGVTIVVEPLNRKECNIINSVAEGMIYVNALAHPNFQCLVDSYHFWLEGESLDHLRMAMPQIAHVHLADTAGRVPPGESGKSDYRPFFKVLKDGRYDKLISVEAAFPDIAGTGARVLEFIKRQWNEA